MIHIYYIPFIHQKYNQIQIIINIYPKLLLIIYIYSDFI